MHDDRRVTYDQVLNTLQKDFEDEGVSLEMLARVIVDLNRIACALERRCPPDFN